MITSEQVNQMMMQQMAAQQQMMDLAQQQNVGMLMGPTGPYQSAIYGRQYEMSNTSAGVNAVAPLVGGIGSAPLYLGQGAAELGLTSKALTGLAGRELGGLAGFGGFMAMDALDPFGTGGVAPWAGVAGMAGVLRSRSFMGAGEKGLIATARGIFSAANGGAAGRAALMRGATVGGGLALAAYLGMEAMKSVVDFTSENLSVGAQQFQSVTNLMSDPQRTLMPGFQGSGSDAMQTLSMFRGMAMDEPTLDTNQLIGLAGGMMESGQFRHTRSAEEFRKTFKERLQTLKEVSSVMNTTLEEASQFLEQQASMGLFGQAGSQNLAFARGMAQAGGLSASTMMQGAGQGAAIARAYGVRGRYGAVSAEYTMGFVGMAERMQVFSEEDLTEATGGLTGGQAISAYSNKMQQYGFNFLQRTGRGRILTAALMDVEGGGIDERRAQMFASGALDWGDLRVMARENLSTREGRLKFRNRRRQLEGQVMEEVGPVAMMGQQAEMMAERYFGSTSLDAVEREEFNDILKRRFTGMSESEASMLSNMVGQGQQIRSRVKQEMSKALADVEAGGQGAQQLGFSQIMDAVVDRVMGPLKQGIQQVGSETTQALSEWYNENFLGVRTINVSQQANRVIQERALGMYSEHLPVGAAPQTMAMLQPEALTGRARYRAGGGTELTVGDRANAFYQMNRTQIGANAGLVDIALATTGNLLTSAQGWSNALFAGAYDELSGATSGMSQQEAERFASLGLGSRSYGGRFTGREDIAAGPSVFGENSLARIGGGILGATLIGGLSFGVLAPIGYNIGANVGEMADRATDPTQTMWVDPRTQTRRFQQAVGNQRGYEQWATRNLGLQGVGQLRLAEAEYARMERRAEESTSPMERARMQAQAWRESGESLFVSGEREMSDAERQAAMQSRDTQALSRGTVEYQGLNFRQMTRPELVLRFMEKEGIKDRAVEEAARMQLSALRTGSEEELGFYVAGTRNIARARVEQGDFSERTLREAQFGTDYDRAVMLAGTDPEKFRQMTIENFANRAAAYSGGTQNQYVAPGSMSRISSAIFGSGDVPASAEQAKALARGQFGAMGTALMESGTAAAISRAGTPEAKKELWQRFLREQMMSGTLDYTVAAKLANADPDALVGGIGTSQEFVENVQAQQAMRMQYQDVYQKRGRGLSYIRGGVRAQELIEGMYANQGVEGAKAMDVVKMQQMQDEFARMAVDDPEQAADLAASLEETGDANSIMVASILRGSGQKYRAIGKVANRKGSRALESEGDVIDILNLGVTDPRAKAFMRQIKKDDNLDMMSLTQLSRLADLTDDRAQKAYVQEVMRALSNDKIIDEKEQLRLARFAAQVPPELAGQYTTGAGGQSMVSEMIRFSETNTQFANAVTELVKEQKGD